MCCIHSLVDSSHSMLLPLPMSVPFVKHVSPCLGRIRILGERWQSATTFAAVCLFWLPTCSCARLVWKLFFFFFYILYYELAICECTYRGTQAFLIVSLCNSELCISKVASTGFAAWFCTVTTAVFAVWAALGSSASSLLRTVCGACLVAYQICYDTDAVQEDWEGCLLREVITALVQGVQDSIQEYWICSCRI